ncbi:unnamed protein product [Owenia fusiformis]|uniref:Uncharacterized protein n=1 Tax=Owenia fusiformis TaxID=6347 RepID=A0A8J1YA05_OWEFU|nr:unnamed protein product [Owenia fusiformis]
MTLKTNPCILCLSFALMISSVIGYVNDSQLTNEINTESCENIDSSVLAINNFTLDLYKQIISPNGIKDVFFSPISVTMALSILLLGADGKTKSEMRNVLHMAGLSDETAHHSLMCLMQLLHSGETGNEFISANKLFPSKHLNVKNAFLRYVERFYDGSVRQLNFSDVDGSMNTINKWVAKRTNNMIKDVLHPGDLDALTVMVLVNAVYFKGEWRGKFLANHTKPHYFYPSPNSAAINVTMMYKTGKFNYHDSTGLDAEFIELPYREDEHQKLSMVLVIPKETYGLPELEQKLTLENLMHGIKQMRIVQKDIFLPKLMLKSRYTLDLYLKALGMKDLFSSEINLSQFSDDQSIALSAVLHEAVIKVTEEGRSPNK